VPSGRAPRREWPLPLAVFIALLTAALLRAIRLGDVPPIYPDEAGQLDVAWSLLHGDFRAGLFTSSFLPRLPLPLAVTYLAAAIGGWNLVAVRVCTVGSALLSLVLLWRLLPREPRDPALVASCFVLAIYPPAIYFSRWGFTYNFLAPALLFVLQQSIAYREHVRPASFRKLAAGVAVALLIEPLGVVALIYGAWVCSRVSWRAAGRLLVIALAPLAAYVALLCVLIPDVLISDVEGIFQTRLTGHPSLIRSIGFNLETPVRQLGWLFAAGIAGLGFAPREVRRGALSILAIHLLVSARTAVDTSQVLRHSIAILPLVCLGLGSLAAWVMLRSERALERRSLPALVVRGGLAVAFVVAALQSATSYASGRVATPYQSSVEPAVDSMQEAADFLNTACRDGDWVLAECLPKRVTCRRGTLSQMAVIEGFEGNPFFPREIYRNRLVEDVHFRDVRFVVISDFTRREEAIYPGVVDLLARIQSWPIVFRRGSVVIREAPVP
jgi:hypothetical protein